MACYRFPDEDHNKDGRHISYLDHLDRYASLDPELFEHLRSVVNEARSIVSLLPALGAAKISDESLCVNFVSVRQRRSWRKAWFSRVLEQLTECDLVFADPDNGIVDDSDGRKGRAKFGKHIPLEEVKLLVRDR